MYVQKFEGETLDEALKMVKRDLGPDAIILKTITNKGLKGAFRKNRIEITAAISEESYLKKAKVDKAIGENQRDSFYNAPSSRINHMINEYNEHDFNPSRTQAGSQSSYGNLGLNKVVHTVSKASQKIKSSLDEFLVPSEADDLASEELVKDSYLDNKRENNLSSNNFINEQQSNRDNIEGRLFKQLDTQRKQIEILENKLFELANKGNNESQKDDLSTSLMQLKTNLQALDLNQAIVSSIIRKARFELSEDDLDEEVVFEFALRELSEMINVDLPLFSKLNQDLDNPVITALVSDSPCGQSSMSLKLASMLEDSVVIRYRNKHIEKVNHELSMSIFKIEVIETETVSHLLTEIRKAVALNKKVILDLKLNAKNDESKKTLEAIKRSWKNLETLAVCSSNHSEIYNKKILSKYNSYLDGVIFTFVDECLSYGALINVHHKYNNLPMKFFGTGQAVPDDIEAATAERLLASMFNL